MNSPITIAKIAEFTALGFAPEQWVGAVQVWPLLDSEKQQVAWQARLSRRMPEHSKLSDSGCEERALARRKELADVSARAVAALVGGPPPPVDFFAQWGLLNLRNSTGRAGEAPREGGEEHGA